MGGRKKCDLKKKKKNAMSLTLHNKLPKMYSSHMADKERKRQHQGQCPNWKTRPGNATSDSLEVFLTKLSPSIKYSFECDVKRKSVGGTFFSPAKLWKKTQHTVA